MSRVPPDYFDENNSTSDYEYFNPDVYDAVNQVVDEIDNVDDEINKQLKKKITKIDKTVSQIENQIASSSSPIDGEDNQFAEVFCKTVPQIQSNVPLQIIGYSPPPNECYIIRLGPANELIINEYINQYCESCDPPDFPPQPIPPTIPLPPTSDGEVFKFGCNTKPPNIQTNFPISYIEIPDYGSPCYEWTLGPGDKNEILNFMIEYCKTCSIEDMPPLPPPIPPTEPPPPIFPPPPPPIFPPPLPPPIPPPIDPKCPEPKFVCPPPKVEIKNICPTPTIINKIEGKEIKIDAADVNLKCEPHITVTSAPPNIVNEIIVKCDEVKGDDKTKKTCFDVDLTDEEKKNCPSFGTNHLEWMTSEKGIKQLEEFATQWGFPLQMANGDTPMQLLQNFAAQRKQQLKGKPKIKIVKG